MLPVTKIRVGSKVLLKVPMSVSVANPVVEFAFQAGGTGPLTWHAGSYDGVAKKGQILVGPGTPVTFVAGVQYLVIGRVVDNPEAPEEELGYIKAV